MRKKKACRRTFPLGLLLSIAVFGRRVHCFAPNHHQFSRTRHLHPMPDELKWTQRCPIPLKRLPQKDGQLVALHSKDQNESQEEPCAADDASRRSLLLLITATATLTTPLSSQAGLPEVDTSGQLYSPKPQMLRGGSDAARGIEQRSSRAARRPLPGETVQTVYSSRFIAYLTRFLLTFDPAAHAWWVQQGYQDSWEDTDVTSSSSYTMGDAAAQGKFAEFAESVEVGLADYFVGPYGSYASVSAAKAGLSAAAPAASARPGGESKKKPREERSILERLGFVGDNDSSSGRRVKRQSSSSDAQAKQGILNLYALMKARYTAVAEKRQMAILFSLIDSPTLQPTAEIRGLLGEADNATITEIELIKPPAVENEIESRTSCRRGGGYSISDSPPKVEMESPPALGDEFREAMCYPIMRPTSRVLRIDVTDRGEGYTSSPNVIVRQVGIRRSCEACAILDREGHVESVIVLNPGYGYGQIGKGYIPPEVRIEPPRKPREASKQDKGPRKKVYRAAKAVAELEYEVVGLNLVQGGNGFIMSEPPGIKISPPAEDPDWYVTSKERFVKRATVPPVVDSFASGRVTAMRLGDDSGFGENIAEGTVIDRRLMDRLRREPLELLPSSIRPEPTQRGGKMLYTIPSLPPPPPFVSIPSPRYRAYDPLFGGIGTVPVTKGATELSASEYSRLALSGAVCTVLVRTLLNPLELVKTKLQLKNDKELNDLASEIMKNRLREDEREPPSSPTHGSALADPVVDLSEDGSVALKTRETVIATKSGTSDEKQATIGTMDMIKSIVKLRGPLALFQSADITFLASLVFGSFGFGATELFRRSFTAHFFTEDTGDGMSEIVLLSAAAVACVITSAAAAPFEVLRVRSMGLVEAKSWKDVLQDFLEDNSRKAKDSSPEDTSSQSAAMKEFRLVDLKPSDLLPLWGGFGPTVSRELPFAVTKFLTFDLIARSILAFVNNQAGEGAMPIQVGVGTLGLAISAFAGAFAGVAGAFVSHPADLILTLTSASDKKSEDPAKKPDWKEILQELLSREGGIANLFLGLPARSAFFFLVIGLQFFLYDYVKTLFQVGLDDLSLVLDVFYAVRQGLVDTIS